MSSPNPINVRPLRGIALVTLIGILNFPFAILTVPLALAQEVQQSDQISSRRNSPRILTVEELHQEQELQRQREAGRIVRLQQIELARQAAFEQAQRQSATSIPRELNEPRRLAFTIDNQRDFRPHAVVEPVVVPAQFQFEIKPNLQPGQESNGQIEQSEPEKESPDDDPGEEIPPPTAAVADPAKTPVNSAPQTTQAPPTELTPYVPTPGAPIPANMLPPADTLQEPSPGAIAPRATPSYSENANTQNHAPPAASQGHPQFQREPWSGPVERYEIRRPGVEKVNVSNNNGLVTIIARDALLSDVLNLLAEKESLSFVHSTTITDRVSIALRDKPLTDALTAVLAIAGYSWTENHGIIYVSSLIGSTPMIPEVSGRDVRVFQLDYASATEVNLVVNGMISGVGKSYVMKSDPRDNRKTGESIVVEDLPGSLHRIEQYIHQIDVPPRQVLIEAYVMEVDLSDNMKNGVNFENLTNVGSSSIRFGTTGAGSGGGNSTGFINISGRNLTALIDALETTTNATTLASPKLLAVNGQESRLQVGQQLGFRVVTTTQTSTIEDVRFLDVGVVLSVTPRIGSDGRIMLKVKPEVSSGLINPDTGLPEENTSEVETSVLLDDGMGMVIGGLIQENDAVIRSKVPVLGNLPVVKHLFRHNQNEKGRSEIIFVLLPRIVDCNLNMHQEDQRNVSRSIQLQRDQYYRSTGPLLDNCLQPSDKRAAHTPQYHDRFTCPDPNCQYHENSGQLSPARGVLHQTAPAENYRHGVSPDAVPLSREFQRPVHNQAAQRQTVRHAEFGPAVPIRSMDHQSATQHKQVQYQEPVQQQRSQHDQTIYNRSSNQYQPARLQQSQSRQTESRQAQVDQSQIKMATRPVSQQNVPPDNRNQFNLQRYGR